MTQSRAAIFDGVAGRIAICEFPAPEPRGEEVLVRVLGCTLCGSDLHSYEGRRPVSAPTVLGHEIVGEIVSQGAAAPTRDLAGRELRVGDRVTWGIVAQCGECFFCRRGLPQKCLTAVKYGHERLSPGRELRGGLAEHCLLAAGTSIVRVPDELPLAVACPASCATATIAAALEAAGELEAANACVLGAGMLGLTACAMLRTRGATEIVCIEPNPVRRVLALSFGATQVADAIGQVVGPPGSLFPHGFDAVLELSGHPSAFDAAWPAIRTGGTLVLVGAVFPSPPAAVSLEQVVRRNLTLRGIHNYAPRHLLAAVEFLGAHQDDFPFSRLVAQWLPLAAVAEAFADAADPGVIRVGVTPGVQPSP